MPGVHADGMSPLLVQFAADHLGPVDVLDSPATTGSSRVVRIRDRSGRRWFARRLAHLVRSGVAVDHGLVHDHASRLAEIPGLVDVATHGDFQPHNWRWRRGRLHAFDFAGAALRPAAYDLGRLRFAACWDRPDLFAALLSGYGRELTPAEQQFMDALLPWRAVVAISMGLRHGRGEMVALSL